MAMTCKNLIQKLRRNTLFASGKALEGRSRKVESSRFRMWATARPSRSNLWALLDRWCWQPLSRR